MSEVRAAGELSKELKIAVELADWAIGTIASYRLEPSEIDTKSGPTDYVTVVDRMVEQRVREVIGTRFPDDVVVGEEMGAPDGDGASSRSPSQRAWHVDPVDGTTNFVFGLPFASFSLALIDAEGLAVGVVGDPYRSEIFSAARGHGAAIDNRLVHCRDRRGLAGALVLTELAAYRAFPGMAVMADRLAEAGTTLRIMGSSALSLTSAGVGRATGAVLGGYQTYDVAAAALIAREAGATLLRRDGSIADGVPTGGDGGLLVAAPSAARDIWTAWTAQDRASPAAASGT